MRVAGYGLRGASYGVRVAGCGLRVFRLRILDIEFEIEESL